MSQGSVSLLNISASDNDDTREHKVCEFAHKGDTEFTAWKDKCISEGVKGIQDRDNLVNNYTDGGKRKPKNPDTFAPPISYMKECGVFKPLPSTTNPLGLCHFYRMDSPCVSTLAPPKPPATAAHVNSLLMLTKMQ